MSTTGETYAVDVQQQRIVKLAPGVDPPQGAIQFKTIVECGFALHEGRPVLCVLGEDMDGRKGVHMIGDSDHGMPEVQAVEPAPQRAADPSPDQEPGRPHH